MRNMETVDHSASRLLATGVAPGDVVALTFPNTAEFVVAFLAMIRCGPTVAPLNHAYTAEEFESCNSDSEAKLLITGKEGNELPESAASKLRIPHVTAILNDGESELSLSPSPDVTTESNWMAGISNEPSNVVLVLRTSGSTSLPKGERFIGSLCKFRESDSTVLVQPLFHFEGLIRGLLRPLVAGAAMKLPQAWLFSAQTSWSDMRRYTGSALLASSVLAPQEEAFGAPFPEDDGPKSVGQEGLFLKTNGMQVNEGVSGEVCIRGPNVTKDCKNNPEANKGAFSFGSFHEEDVGCFDPDGYLHLVGGIEEPVNRGEEIIAPIEVDEVILSHPDVDRDVAFGVPDDKQGKEHALGYTMPMIRHSINDSPSRGEADFEMATNVGANGVVAADVLPREDNLEDVITDIEADGDQAAVPREDNLEDVITAATGDETAVPRENNNLEDANARTIKKIGPQCLWALGCIITALVAVAGLPIFGRRFTLVICIVVIVASFCRVLLTYLMWKKGTPENMDIP